MSLRRVSLIVYDKPTPLSRPRFRVTPKGVQTYTVRKDQEARLAIRSAWVEQAGNTLLLGPLRLTVTAFLPMPKSIPKKHQATALPVKRPDLDNYVKQVEDALQGYAFRDDSQIVSIMARKRYAIQEGITPSWMITLDEIGVGD